MKTSRAQLQQNTEETKHQLELTRQGQITDRFTRAIEQLDTKVKSNDVVIGGIYSLQWIARDSPEDRITIGVVLSSYIRAHAPWPPRLERQPRADTPIARVPELRKRAPDIQAALTVLGRGWFTDAELRKDELSRETSTSRNLSGESGCLNLAEADLRKADLRNANLKGVDLQGANLEGAILIGADLAGAKLFDTDLREANLTGADFTGAEADGQTDWPTGLDHRAVKARGVRYVEH